MYNYAPQIINSGKDPAWSVMSYTNGYYFFLTDSCKKQAVVRGFVPRGVLKELDPIAQARMK